MLENLRSVLVEENNLKVLTMSFGINSKASISLSYYVGSDRPVICPNSSKNKIFQWNSAVSNECVKNSFDNRPNSLSVLRLLAHIEQKHQQFYPQPLKFCFLSLTPSHIPYRYRHTRVSICLHNDSYPYPNTLAQIEQTLLSLSLNPILLSQIEQTRQHLSPQRILSLS